MDISESYKKDTVVINEFYFPDGERIRDKDDQPCWIELAGPHSDVYKEALAQQSREMAKKQKEKGRAKNSGFTKSEYEEMIERGIKFQAQITVSWGGWELEGKPAQCTLENVQKLYDNAPFVRQEIDDALKDETLFMKK